MAIAAPPVVPLDILELDVPRPVGLVRRIAWVVAVVVGAGLLVAGPVLVGMGIDGRHQVRDQLRAEKIVTAEDASIPNAKLEDAATAQAQADVIWKHMMKTSGGKTYAQLDRQDPKRETLSLGDSLRSALLSAVLAWNIANLVIGLGVAFIGLGLGLGFVGLALRPRTA